MTKKIIEYTEYLDSIEGGEMLKSAKTIESLFNWSKYSLLYNYVTISYFSNDRSYS